MEPGLPRCYSQLLPTLCEDDIAGRMSQAGTCGLDKTGPGISTAVGGVIPRDTNSGSSRPGEG